MANEGGRVEDFLLQHPCPSEKEEVVFNRDPSVTPSSTPSGYVLDLVKYVCRRVSENYSRKLIKGPVVWYLGTGPN